MAVTFVVVPQWQGSPSSRAMRQAEGAAAIREDLPAGATRDVEVPLEAGDDQSTGIARFSSLQLVRERLTDVLGELDGPAVTIGGDCAVSAAAVAHAARERRHGARLVRRPSRPELARDVAVGRVRRHGAALDRRRRRRARRARVPRGSALVGSGRGGVRQRGGHPRVRASTSSPTRPRSSMRSRRAGRHPSTCTSTSTCSTRRSSPACSIPSRSASRRARSSPRSRRSPRACRSPARPSPPTRRCRRRAGSTTPRRS